MIIEKTRYKVLLGFCLVLAITVVLVFVLLPPSQSHSLVNRHDFEYIISEPKCKAASNSVPLAVILVQSAPGNVTHRDTIRKTWFHTDAKMLFYFVIASSESEEVQKQVKVESLRYKDIIQGNFLDSVENRIYKHAMTFKWFLNSCGRVKYLIKIDDDIFMNVPAVVEYLQSNKANDSHIIGFRQRAQMQIRVDEDKTSPDYEKYLAFPKYAMGFAVIYTKEFVKAAYAELKQPRITLHDDVYITGVIRSMLNMEVTAINERFIHNVTGDFEENFINSSNSNFLFTFGGVDSHAMASLWRQTSSDYQNTFLK